jgi:hypothetical protein
MDSALYLSWARPGTADLRYEGEPKKNRIFFKKYNLFTFQTQNT